MKTQSICSRVTAAILAVALSAAPARAAYDDVGVSARVTGLGRAYTALADDANAIYYNPAGLALLDRPEFSTSYARLLTGLSDGSNVQNSFMAYAQPMPNDRPGGLGVAWNYFTLDGLYRESSVLAAYGRRITPEDRIDSLFGGVTLKFLDRSLGGSAAAGNALDQNGYSTGTSDPLLQHSNKINFDADLGLLYRLRTNWTLGMQIQHLLAPNVAFSSGQTDSLGRNVKFGAAYKTPFAALTGDFDLATAPDGSLDKNLEIGAEKWLPTLIYGSFALRGGLGVGTRDFRQLAVGLSYKIHRLQVDYGLLMPVGSFSSTSGTHRFGLTWRFGAPRVADELLGTALLENLTGIAAPGTPEFKRQADELVGYKRKAVEALLREADSQAQLGRLDEAHTTSKKAVSIAPSDPLVSEVDSRYQLAASFFPDVSNQLKDPAIQKTHSGIMLFIAGRNAESLAALVAARTATEAPALEGLIHAIERRAGLSAEKPAAAVSTPAVTPAVVVSTASAPPATPNPPSEADSKARMVESASSLLEVSFFQHEWDKVIALAEQVLALDAANAHAYKRMGGAYHALGKKKDALRALKAAFALETDEAERAKLQDYISALKSSMAPAPKATVAPAPKPATAAASPADVERAYEAGVELYARGKLTEARAAFQHCLQLDATYVPAQRALQRVQSELMQSGSNQ